MHDFQTSQTSSGDGAKASPLDNYLTREQCAAALRCHIRSLDRLHALGKGPPRIMVAGKAYYDLAGLRRWVADQQG